MAWRRGLHRLPSWLAAPAANGELAHYQFQAFSKQLPVLYAILLINAAALAATHYGTAPGALTLGMPCALFTICLCRLAFWIRSTKVHVSAEDAGQRLRATTRLVGGLGVAFTAWSLSLYPYGDAYARCHVAYYMSITVISCIFCLMHLRQAALLLTFVVVVPFTLFFCLTGQPVLIAIAVNFQLVACGMVFILQRNYRDFTTMVVSQQELLVRQADMLRLNDENFRLATMDGLTGLPNRRRFLSQLDHVLNQSRTHGQRFAVALVDLDGFKGVNDVHGHAAGDRLLVEVGERLTALAGPSVFFSRLGGDEFGAILQAGGEIGGEFGGALPDAEIQAFGKVLCRTLQGPYLAQDAAADVSGSAGLVAYPDGGESAQVLFERADYALYFAKQHKVGEAVMFSQAHETMIRDSGRIEQALRRADLAAELSPAFQPIVDGETGRTLGFEALARWTSPELGRIGPDVFIPIAERTQLVSRITETVFAKALAAAAGWPRDLRISLNLSAQDISSPNTMAAVRRIVSRSGVAPARIDIEVTETAVMRDFDQAAEAIASLRNLGLHISLDDFGTGFSSLSHVHKLPLDKIKIDRSFVADINANRKSADIVKTIVDLCRNLNLLCIVEGVETEAQRWQLMALGCRIMQGYLFAKPIPEAGVARYIACEEPAMAMAG
jgi:diguanylate cyclase (GGDEF)-like protein